MMLNLQMLLAPFMCLLAGIMPVRGADVQPLPVLGDERPELYLPLLQGRKVALLSNHTGVDRDSVHIVDKLLAEGVNVTMLLSPEHGFRGTADAGERVKGSVDAATGLPIVSLYGSAKALTADQLRDIDVIVVDLQDVGLRFYTYYISMLRMMNEAARAGKQIVVLDRPNPNGMTVDGPTLDMSLSSGVGRLPIPVVHGMTMGELALMINGEGWLKDGRTVQLEVVPMEHYDRSRPVRLVNMPSPNLRTMHAIYLYPSTCLFEGTVMSLGRGTEHPFEIYGHPRSLAGDYRFTPRPMPGATTPPLQGRECRGRDLRSVSDSAAIAGGVNLEYVIDAYRNFPEKDKFFIPFFDLLIGDRDIKEMIRAGKSAAEIKATWADDVDAFLRRRSPYLLY